MRQMDHIPITHFVDQDPMPNKEFRPKKIKGHSSGVKRILGKKTFRSLLEILPIKSSPFHHVSDPKKIQNKEAKFLAREMEYEESFFKFKLSFYYFADL